jgi:hypothetical protein
MISLSSEFKKRKEELVLIRRSDKKDFTSVKENERK